MRAFPDGRIGPAFDNWRFQADRTELVREAESPGIDGIIKGAMRPPGEVGHDADTIAEEPGGEQ